MLADRFCTSIIGCWINLGGWRVKIEKVGRDSAEVEQDIHGKDEHVIN
jgi:hypothetical protein